MPLATSGGTSWRASAAILGAEAQSVAVAWQVYSITHRAIDLGYTGLALFLPGLIFLLPAGHVADRFDRRHVILICYSLQVFCDRRAGAAGAEQHAKHSGHLRGAVFHRHGARVFRAGELGAGSAPGAGDHFVNAVTWGGAIFQFANITGPALGGLLFTFPLAHFLPHSRLEGAGIVYVFTLVTLVWYPGAGVHAATCAPGRMEHRDLSLKVVLAGFRLCAARAAAAGIVFAGPVCGAAGRSDGADADFCARYSAPGTARTGHAARRAGGGRSGDVAAPWRGSRSIGTRGAWLFICVSIFGVATVVFGLSRAMWLSLASLAVAGAADTISVIIRGSLLQLATPPAMRGRVSAVNSLFIGASNELGEFESGLTAQWWGAVRATVIGGVGALVVAGLWAVMFPSLRRADELTAESLRENVPEPREVLSGL